MAFAPKNYDLQLVMHNDDGEPYKNTDYMIKKPDGYVVFGKTDGKGMTEVFYSPTPDDVEIHMLFEKDEQPK